MTTSHSEEDKPQRQWSVLPARCVGDKRLKERELRILGALCIHTNSVGVCWPSMDTLKDLTGYAERRSVYDAMKRLKSLGYVRQLDPKDYQIGPSGWKSNRYQVLWKGDEEVPRLEDIHIAKPLQPRKDEENAPEKEIGGLGDAQDEIQIQAHALTHAYLRAVQQKTGQVKLFDNEVAHGRKLAGKIAPAELQRLTTEVCEDWLKRRAGVPSLYDIAERIL